MPLHRRLPKRGFNPPSPLDLNEVNLGRVQSAIDAGKLDAGKPITVEALIAAGVVARARDGVKMLGKGEFKAKADFRSLRRVEERGRGDRKGRRQRQDAQGRGRSRPADEGPPKGVAFRRGRAI